MREFEDAGEVSVNLAELVRGDERKMEVAVLRAAEKQGLPVQHGAPHPGYEYQFQDDPENWVIKITWRKRGEDDGSNTVH